MKKIEIKYNKRYLWRLVSLVILTDSSNIWEISFGHACGGLHQLIWENSPYLWPVLLLGGCPDCIQWRTEWRWICTLLLLSVSCNGCSVVMLLASLGSCWFDSHNDGLSRELWDGKNSFPIKLFWLNMSSQQCEKTDSMKLQTT